MTTLEQLLEAARRQPSDLLGWHAIADLLEEQGETDRAEVLRLDLLLRQSPPSAPEREDRHRHLRERLEGGTPPCLPGFVNGLGMELRLVPPGAFLMGPTAGEDNDDGAQHEVEITRAYYLGVHTVTVGQFRAFVRATAYRTEAETGNGAYGLTKDGWRKDRKYHWQKPGFPQDEDHPVVCVSWNDAVAFCRWLGQQETGRAYRLPTEAEWEHACRGGARENTPYHFGLALSSTQANYNGKEGHGPAAQGEYRARTVPVGAFVPNAFGLWQMHGNVWEWCADWYDEEYYTYSPRCDPCGPAEDTERVLRGGGWLDWAGSCTSGQRLSYEPTTRYSSVGFRVALDGPGASS